MRVLGIDPGSRITGYGVVESRGASLVHIDSGSFRIKDNDTGARLRCIFENVQRVMEDHRPHAVAVEKVFVARNARSALMLGQARGAAIVASGGKGVELEEYSPLEIKMAVVGQGRAAKEQVQHMVRVLLNLSAIPESDTADALACAICHINTATSRARYAAAGDAL